MQPAQNQQIAALFHLLFVVGAAVHQVSLHRAYIIRPLLLQVDQRPLPPAEHKVLQSRQHNGALLGHPMRMQLTPSGSLSSTVTI